MGPDGKITGVGKEIDKTKLMIYEGQFKQDVFHGYGRKLFDEGQYYIGNWNEGQMHGKGKLISKDG